MKRIDLAAAVAFVSFGIVMACGGSGSTPDTAPAGTRGTDDPAVPTPTDASGTATPAPSSSSGSPGPSGDAGAGAADPGAAAACLNKCGAGNVQGATEFGAILVPCACAASACGTACSTCASAKTGLDLLGAGASEACRTCVKKSLGNGGSCNTQLREQCPAKASCPSFALCALQCT